MRPKQDADGAWLLPFLLSDPVQTVLQWSQTGSNHPRFESKTLLDLPIPDTVVRQRLTLAASLSTAIADFERSRSYYEEAEQELLQRLSWEQEIDKSDDLFFFMQFARIANDARIDAEHFQPKFYRLRERLKSLHSTRIGDFCEPPSRGVQPMFVADGDVWVLASKAIRPQGVVLDEDGRTSLEFWEAPASEKGRVRPGDVLLNSTGVGTLGRASYYIDGAPALADNHVSLLRPDQSICLPVYLSLFLNTKAGLWQSEMYQTGSSGQLEIYPHHIEDILVFLPRDRNGSVDLPWQRMLVDKVLAARLVKQETRDKLLAAKSLIEGSMGSLREKMYVPSRYS